MGTQSFPQAHKATCWLPLHCALLASWPASQPCSVAAKWWKIQMNITSFQAFLNISSLLLCLPNLLCCLYQHFFLFKCNILIIKNIQLHISASIQMPSSGLLRRLITATSEKYSSENKFHKEVIAISFICDIIAKYPSKMVVNQPLGFVESKWWLKAQLSLFCFKFTTKKLQLKLEGKLPITLLLILKYCFQRLVSY